MKHIECPEWAEEKVIAYLKQLQKERDSKRSPGREFYDFELCQVPGCSAPTDKHTSPQTRCEYHWSLYID